MPTLGDLNIKLILDIVAADKNAQKFTTTLKSVEAETNKVHQSTQKLGGNAFPLLAVGIAGAIAGLTRFLFTSVQVGAEFEELSSNFAGSAKDMELFRKATSGTVTDGSLIKLSNYANDLGVAMKDQPLLFSLAEDAADKYGGSVESNFNAVINATDGTTRGLRAVGISTKEFGQEVERLVSTMGKKLDAMSADEQQNIRLQAIYNLTGTTLDSVNSKTQSHADKLAGVRVQYQNLQTLIGIGLVTAFVKMTGKIGETNDAFEVSIKKAMSWGDSIGFAIKKSVTFLIWGKKAADELQREQTLQNNLEKMADDYNNSDRGRQNVDIGPTETMENYEARMLKRAVGDTGSAPIVGSKTGSRGTGNIPSNVKEFVSYLEKLTKDLDEINDRILKQSSAQSEAEGLFVKKNDLLNLIDYVSNLEKFKQIASEIITLPEAGRGMIELVPEDKILKFRIAIQDAKKAAQETAAQYDKITSDLSAAYSLITAISNKFTDGGRSFLSYLEAGLQIAIQIASYIKKSDTKEGVSFFDFLPILGSILPLFASGGIVQGQGAGDSTIIRATPGEGILNRLAMSNVGAGFVNWLNNGGSIRGVMSASMMQSGSPVIINVSGDLTDHLRYDIVSKGNVILNRRNNNSNY